VAYIYVAWNYASLQQSGSSKTALLHTTPMAVVLPLLLLSLLGSSPTTRAANGDVMSSLKPHAAYSGQGATSLNIARMVARHEQILSVC